MDLQTQALQEQEHNLVNHLPAAAELEAGDILEGLIQIHLRIRAQAVVVLVEMDLTVVLVELLLAAKAA